jgi:hypothetical protein
MQMKLFSIPALMQRHIKHKFVIQDIHDRVKRELPYTMHYLLIKWHQAAILAGEQQRHRQEVYNSLNQTTAKKIEKTDETKSTSITADRKLQVCLVQDFAVEGYIVLQLPNLHNRAPSSR